VDSVKAQHIVIAFVLTIREAPMHADKLACFVIFYAVKRMGFGEKYG
jgi:hypothetical protein